MNSSQLAVRIGTGALALTAFLLPWLVFVSDRATAWLIGPVALAAAAARIASGGGYGLSRPALLGLLGLAGIVALAVLSPGWGESELQKGMAKQAWRMAPSMIAVLVLLWGVSGLSAGMAPIRRALVVGCGLAALIVIVDAFSGRWLLRIRHAVAEGGFGSGLLERAAGYEPAEFLALFNDFWVVATLCFTLLALLSGRHWVLLASLAALFAASLLTISETSLVMALAGFLTAVLVRLGGSRALQFVNGMIVAAILTTPWLFPALDRFLSAQISGGSTLTHKIRERSEIWAALAETVPDRLILGHGIAFQRLNVVYPGPKEYFFLNKLWHPHSIFVQIWQDLGLVGAALLSLAVTGLFMAIRRAPAELTPGLAALSVMSFGALGAAHSIWLAWWLCCFFLLAALAIVCVRNPVHIR